MVIFMKENNSPFINVDDLPKSELGNVKFYAEDNGKIIKEVFLNCFDIVVKNSKDPVINSTDIGFISSKGWVPKEPLHLSVYDIEQLHPNTAAPYQSIP